MVFKNLCNWEMCSNIRDLSTRIYIILKMKNPCSTAYDHVTCQVLKLSVRKTHLYFSGCSFLFFLFFFLLLLTKFVLGIVCLLVCLYPTHSLCVCVCAWVGICAHAPAITCRCFIYVFYTKIKSHVTLLVCPKVPMLFQCQVYMSLKVLLL